MCAVSEVSFIAAAVPAVPVTSARVILIITSAVSSPFCYVTGCFALFSGLVFWILAGAGTTFQDVLRRAEMIFRPASLA